LVFDPPGNRYSTAASGGCFASFLFAILLVAGATVFWAYFREPWGLLLAARSWEQVPCTVIASRLEPVSADAKGRSVKRRLDFRYSYTHRGEVHRSSNVWFIKPDLEEARRLIQRYPRDTATFCWVNPANPGESYLHRGFRAELLLALFPLALALLGVIGLLWQLTRRLRGPAPPGHLSEDA
jgi:hypothetical protein